MPRWLVGLMLCGLLRAVPAVAQEAAAPTPAAVDLGADRVTIGAGPAIIPRYSGAKDTVVVPGVAIQGQLSGYSFSTQGTSLSVDLVPGGGGTGWKVQAGPTLNLRLDRDSFVGDGPVAALGKLKTAWEPGAWLGIQRTGVVTSPYDTLSFGLSWQHDIAGAHDDYVISPALSYSTPLSHHDYASVGAGADYIGHRFGAYYYDVSAAGSAASGLRPYDGADHAGWKDWNLSLLAAHTIRGTLTHGIALFGTAGYSRLLGRYARSPIVADVGDPDQWSGSVGVAITL